MQLHVKEGPGVWNMCVLIVSCKLSASVGVSVSDGVDGVADCQYER
jgi:hypothetical protein